MTSQFMHRLALAFTIAAFTAPIVACVDVTGSLVADSDPVDLGSVEIAEVLEGAVVLENSGEHDIEIRLAGWDADADGAFRFQGAPDLPSTLFPGDTMALGLAFKTNEPGDYSGEIAVTYGQANKDDEGVVLTVGVTATAIGMGADEDGDGWPVDGGDCDDTDPEVHPEADELCNGHDDDCDGAVPEDEVDGDGDGVMVCDNDCDDEDPAVHPGADEGCDGIDTDCDGVIEDEMDDDGDGHTVCEGDCDDANADVHPGADEGCDGIDTNCDGLLSQNEEDIDADGYSICDGDCADEDENVYPGAPELCNGHDDDCDGQLDAGEADVDGDGALACLDDCDDTNPDVHPGAPEMCNGHDDDCDGYPDPDEVDADGDGVMVCDNDCSDIDPDIYPGAPEVCNGYDDDCDGLPGQDETDFDADGYMICDGDCSDTHAETYPGAPELCDGHDNDCDWDLPADEEDADGDGLMACDGDCDDSDEDVHPGATEVCDGVDNDCDGDLMAACDSCGAVLQAGLSTGDGIYEIDLDGPGPLTPMDLLCNMTVDGGGWTLIQQTTDDWNDTGALVTDYDTFVDTTVGDPTGAFRLAGELWNDLLVDGELLMSAVVRNDSGDACGDPLFYGGIVGGFDFPPGGPGTVSGVQQDVMLLAGDTLSTTDTGPSDNCIANDAVPWFYLACCQACPSYGGTFYTPPSPMVRFLDADADLQGNLAGDVCPDPLDQSGSFEGVSVLGYFLR